MRKAKVKKGSSVRASASLPPELYRMLEAIAKEKKVSVAWVIRDASEKYVNDRWPLFGNKSRRLIERGAGNEERLVSYIS